MKKLMIPLLAVPLFLALPAGTEASDLRLTNLQVSIGIGNEPNHRRQEVYVVERAPDRKHRHEGWKKGHRRHHREEPRVIVIEDRHHRRSCDSAPVIVRGRGPVWIVSKN